MSIQRYDTCVGDWEPLDDGDFVNYVDHVSDKAAALESAQESIDRGTGLLEDAAKALVQQSGELDKLRAQILRMNAAGDALLSLAGDSPCHTGMKTQARTGWKVACAEADEGDEG